MRRKSPADYSFVLFSHARHRFGFVATDESIMVLIKRRKLLRRSKKFATADVAILVIVGVNKPGRGVSRQRLCRACDWSIQGLLPILLATNEHNDHRIGQLIG